MSAGERPLHSVSGWLIAALAVALGLQLLVSAVPASPNRHASDLPPAPTPAMLRLVGLGEPPATARIAMLWLQAFDAGGTNEMPYRKLDYGRLIGWLGAILEIDPLGHYPLFAAARIYAEVSDQAKARQMLEFIYQAYQKTPAQSWPALAHAALLAKHRLRDLPLARRYAAAIQAVAHEPSVPMWAKQMEIFILEDMNELEAAKIMLGGLLVTGQVTDAAERRFLQGRLEDLERRLAGAQRTQKR